MRAAKKALDLLAPEKMRVATDEIGVAYNTFAQWRAGRRTPSIRSLLKIARAADDRADRLRGLSEEIRRVVEE